MIQILNVFVEVDLPHPDIKKEKQRISHFVLKIKLFLEFILMNVRKKLSQNLYNTEKINLLINL